nr:hypothetical protein Iba_chr09fCG13660 [Ipomoea batatas]
MKSGESDQRRGGGLPLPFPVPRAEASVGWRASVDGGDNGFEAAAEDFAVATAELLIGVHLLCFRRSERAVEVDGSPSSVRCPVRGLQQTSSSSLLLPAKRRRALDGVGSFPTPPSLLPLFSPQHNVNGSNRRQSIGRKPPPTSAVETEEEENQSPLDCCGEAAGRKKRRCSPLEEIRRTTAAVAARVLAKARRDGSHRKQGREPTSSSPAVAAVERSSSAAAEERRMKTVGGGCCRSSPSSSIVVAASPCRRHARCSKGEGASKRPLKSVPGTLCCFPCTERRSCRELAPKARRGKEDGGEDGGLEWLHRKENTRVVAATFAP